MKNLVLLVTVLFLTSCATITSSTKQEIYISAKPENARIYVDNNKVGEGATTVEVVRKKRHEIVVKAEGYETGRIRTSRSLRAGYAVANITMCFIPYVNLFGLPSTLVDAITGAWYKQDEDEYFFDLDKK